MATRDYRSVQTARDSLLQAMDEGDYHSLYGGQPSQSGFVPTPGATYEDLTRDYRRREEGAGGVGRGAASGASLGAAAGSVVPGLGTIAGGVIGGIGGAIGGAFTKNAESAYTDFAQQDARDAIANAYRSYLGRDASPDELNSQLMGQGWQPGDRWVGEAGLQSVINSIRDSDEARGYRPASAAATGGAAPAPGQGTVVPATGTFTGGSGALVDPYTLAPEEELAGLLANAQRYSDYDASTGRTGFAGGGIQGYASHGFDFAQDPGNRDIGKSAKYAFTHFANEAARTGAPMPTTKEEAQVWFAQYVQPGMEAAGFTVHQVVGDKAFISTREFPQGQWVDFLSNAGGDNPALWWGAENPGEGGGMAMAGGGLGQSARPGVPANADLTSSALFEELLKQARAAAQGGGPSPLTTDRNAMLALMG